PGRFAWHPSDSGLLPAWTVKGPGTCKAQPQTPLAHGRQSPLTARSLACPQRSLHPFQRHRVDVQVAVVLALLEHVVGELDADLALAGLDGRGELVLLL